MTDLQKTYLERISSLADSIFMVARSANCTETECVKTLAEMINETADKILEENVE